MGRAGAGGWWLPSVSLPRWQRVYVSPDCALSVENAALHVRGVCAKSCVDAYLPHHLDVYFLPPGDRAAPGPAVITAPGSECLLPLWLLTYASRLPIVWGWSIYLAKALKQSIRAAAHQLP